MGTKPVKFKFTPEKNEQIEAVVRVPEEHRSIIHGIVIDCENMPVKNAVVKLLAVRDINKQFLTYPITYTFTDDLGEFLFGPLCPDKCYIIKVWYNDVKIRELVISPGQNNDLISDKEPDESESSCKEDDEE